MYITYIINTFSFSILLIIGSVFRIESPSEIIAVAISSPSEIAQKIIFRSNTHQPMEQPTMRHRFILAWNIHSANH